MRASTWITGCAVLTVLASSATGAADDPAEAGLHRIASPIAAAQAHLSQTAVTSPPPAEYALGMKVRRLRIAGWTTFSAGWVFFGLGFVFLDQGSMDEAPWLRRIAGLETTAFALLTTSGALLLRARLIVWRRGRRTRTLALSASPSGLRATWSF